MSGQITPAAPAAEAPAPRVRIPHRDKRSVAVAMTKISGGMDVLPMFLLLFVRTRYPKTSGCQPFCGGQSPLRMVIT